MPIGTNPTISTFGSVGLGRDYTSLSTWENDTALDLVALAISHHLECYDDAVFNLGIVFLGATSNATYHRSIGAATGEGHGGIPTGGVRFAFSGSDRCFDVQEPHVHLFDLVLTSSITSSGDSMSLRFLTAGAGLVERCLFYNSNNPGAGAGYGLAVQNTSGQVVIANCAAIDNKTRGMFVGASGTATIYFYNCTSAGNVDGFRRNTGSPIAKNCLAHGNTTGFVGTFAAGTVTNASSDATAPGTGSRNSQTFTFVNAAAKDYHLDATDTGARTFGTDLSGDAIYPFTTDVDGEAWGATWDIGFDKVASVGGSPTRRNLVLTGVGL